MSLCRETCRNASHGNKKPAAKNAAEALQNLPKPPSGLPETSFNANSSPISEDLTKKVTFTRQFMEAEINKPMGLVLEENHPSVKGCVVSKVMPESNADAYQKSVTRPRACLHTFIQSHSNAYEIVNKHSHTNNRTFEVLLRKTLFRFHFRCTIAGCRSRTCQLCVFMSLSPFSWLLTASLLRSSARTARRHRAAAGRGAGGSCKWQRGARDDDR